MTLREQVFRKMGWQLIPELSEGTNYFPKGNYWCGKEWPPIDSQWEVTAKYLVPFMREKKNRNGGYTYSIEPYVGLYGENEERHFMQFEWCHEDFGAYTAKIKDDNIAEAACKAFMEVKLDE